MPLRIAFDMDGVFADMEGELVRNAELLFGEAVTQRLQERPATAADQPPPAPSADEEKRETETALESAPALVRLRMTTRQQRRLWQHVEATEDFWESLGEIEPGSIASLYELSRTRRWEIIFLTKRPETAGSTAQIQTQKWLESKGFKLPSVYVVQGSRGRIAAALGLDLVVDDRPENCLDVVVDSRARALLVWREGERQLPAAARRLGIGVVKSIDECLDILTRVDSPGPEQPRIVDRVMRMLGLKEPTSA